MLRALSGSPSRRDEQPRSFGARVGRKRYEPRAAEPARGEQPRDVIFSEAEPHVAHLLPVALAIVRQHVDEHEATARLEDPRGLRERALADVARVLKPQGRAIVVDMLPHDRESYRQQMGHVWLGFSDEHVRRLFQEAGFEEVRIVSLPPDVKAKGPGLFVATARRPLG